MIRASRKWCGQVGEQLNVGEMLGVIAGPCCPVPSPSLGRAPVMRCPPPFTSAPAVAPVQEKKQLVFEGTVGQDSAALARLTEDDLRFLFG